MKNIFVIFAALFITLWDGAPQYATFSAPVVINVFAGNDRTVCHGQSLVLSTLNALISGDVSDGDWISFGDGRFQPGNRTTVRFSEAQNGQISYQPGPNDLTLGFYRLMLLSDPPVNNPSERVTDEVRITFQHAPPLFCSGNIHVSLDERCQQKVTAQMVSPNAIPPYNNYIITLFDENNNVIPGNILDARHLDMTVTYRLGHQCTSNICWGTLKVEDYYPPQFVCRNDTVVCSQSVLPDSLGLPIPAQAVIDTVINGIYWVSDWDYCSLVQLSFTETVRKAECARDEDKTITRRWTARDAKGNTSQCIQNIVVKRIGLSSVVFPPHFNDVDMPAFLCSDTFPQLANGYPSPDTTGTPGITGCGHLQSTMTDVKFDLCGAGYKIARSWFVIDWCSTESVTRNQIIEVKDKTAPVIACRDSIFLSADAYECFTTSAPVPGLISVEDCSDYLVTYQLKDSAGQIRPFINQGGHFERIPVGEYILEYIATDVCGFSATCESHVSVLDETTPFPACKAFVNVSLGISGTGRVFATSYDNNSLDNCGIAKIEARKMVNICGPQVNEFSDYVDFCCGEIGTSVMVEVRVTDVYGNSNTCMVETLIEDKLPPVITCPPHITLQCNDSYDVNDLSRFGRVVNREADRRNIVLNNDFHQGVVGRDGLASDNCTVQITERVETDIDCHTGRIRRIFTATDAGGRQDSCTQVITIVNTDPFNENDILWPDHFSGEGCRVDQLPPDTTGRPTFLRVDCAQVASTHTDQLFYSQDSACLKIIREWYVIDWCQFDDNHLTGRWGPYYQTIKVQNRIAPVLSTPCRDTTFCSYDPQCQAGFVHLVMNATDDCSPTSELTYLFDIDLYYDGDTDTSGLGSEIKGQYPLGEHRVTWTVTDPCGNASSCSYMFSVVDCKKPTPYCISSLTVNIDEVTHDTEIWAIDFDFGSTDNCTDDSDLLFTFNEALPVRDSLNKEHYFKGNGLAASWDEYLVGLAQKWIPSKRSSALRFTCEDIEGGVEDTISLQMTVLTPDGQMDYCEVELILQDPHNVCEDARTSLKISGEISNTQGQIPEQTMVHVRASELDFETTLDENTGTYTVGNLPLDHSFSVSASSDSDPLKGLSTLDIVLTQRHLLDLVPFSSPYQFVAADVNRSGSLTASDLVVMRRMILGITDRFPNNVPSWIFIPEKDGFAHPDNPFSYITEWKTEETREDINALNFIGVKMGDVNFSYSQSRDDDVSYRKLPKEKPHFYISSEEVHEKKILVLRAARNMQVDGWQLFLNIPGLLDAQPWTFDNFEQQIHIHAENNIFHAMMYHDNARVYLEGDIIASFMVEGDTDVSDITLREFRNSEIYLEGKTHPLYVSSRSQKNQDIRLKTNPVTETLRIQVPDEFPGEYTYDIYSSDGRQIQSGQFFVSHGEDEYVIDLPSNVSPGVSYVRIKHGDEVQTLKFIVVR